MEGVVSTRHQVLATRPREKQQSSIGRAFPQTRQNPPTGRRHDAGLGRRRRADPTSDRADRLRAGVTPFRRRPAARRAGLRAGRTVAGVPAGRAAGRRASGLARLVAAGGVLHLLLAEVGDGSPPQFKPRLLVATGLGQSPSSFGLHGFRGKHPWAEVLGERKRRCGPFIRKPPGRWRARATGRRKGG